MNYFSDQLLPVEESKPVVEEDTEYECENEADNVVTIPINAGLDEVSCLFLGLSYIIHFLKIIFHRLYLTIN